MKFFTIGFVLLMMASFANAANFSISTTFAFEEQEAYPVTGFNLYMDGDKVCSTDDPDTRIMNCVFPAEPGGHLFTMTAQYGEVESAMSPNYAFSFIDLNNVPEILRIEAVIQVTINTREE